MPSTLRSALPHLKLRSIAPAALLACLAVSGCGEDDTPSNTPEPVSSPATGEPDPKTNFFVSSDTSATGNLGGLTGADARCTRLAQAAGLSGDFVAYLSVEHDPSNDGGPVNARDRIGNGPWYNSKGTLLASNLDALHARKGDADVFLDEYGTKIPGQWPDSPKPVEHDILTGTSPDGTVVAGQTCEDWTSAAAGIAAMVGHSDGLGPGGDPTGMYSSWNSSHASGGCDNTAPRGGSGRIYCFAKP